MTIWGSFTTSMMAMNAHSHHMEQIGTNIANMNTTSYKEVDTTYETVTSHAKGGKTFFSANPVDTRRVSVQGSLFSTDNAYDLAIDGRGFFVTNASASGTGETFYTRDGSFATRSHADPEGRSSQASRLVSAAGTYLMGWAADGDGGYEDTLSAVEVNHTSLLPAKATTRITLSGNVANNNGAAATHTTGVTVVATNADGTQSRSHTLGLNWSKTVTDTNRWTLSVDGPVESATLSPPTILFSDDGTLDTTNGTGIHTLTMTWNDGSEPSTVTLDLAHMTQYASTQGLSIDDIESDGYQEGRLVKTSFNASGVLSGYYDNNQTLDLYKLPVATFVAPDALRAVQGNAFQTTQEAGAVTLEHIDTRAGGVRLVPGALETSNVDLEDQFSRMITTQKAYTMASTAFRTNDEMIQELRDMKR